MITRITKIIKTSNLASVLASYDDDGGDDDDRGDDEMGHLRVPGSGRNDKPATRFRTRLSAENISSKKFSEEKNVKKNIRNTETNR